ncbi:MAG: SET domain-containing protein-lysine N-methyltransferase, partial [Dehalococcoidia bacterium]
MVHPQTKLGVVNPKIGYGVFATAFIPKGTIVYARDPLEIELTPGEYQALEPMLKETVDKYAYMDKKGIRVLSWDFGKYVNHRCECNSMNTG